MKVEKEKIFLLTHKGKEKMEISEKFYNIKCDICGALVDEDTWQGDVRL